MMNGFDADPIGSSRNNRSLFDRIHGVIHWALSLGILAIVILGIDERREAIRVMVLLLGPVGDFLVDHFVVITSVSQHSKNPIFFRDFLILLYAIVITTYAHSVFWYLFRTRNRVDIEFEKSSTANYKFYCNTIYKDFSPIANPFCLLIGLSKKESSPSIHQGSVFEGFRFYSTKPTVWAGYLALAILIFVFLPTSERVMGGHLFLPVGVSVAFYLLIVAQVSTAFEALILFAVWVATATGHAVALIKER